MAPVTITVQPAQVDAVRVALLTLYEVEAESLQHACAAHVRERASSAVVRAKRATLLEVDALVAQAGVELGPTGPEPVALSAPAAVLDDVLHAALLEAVERLEVGAGQLSRTRAAPGEVHALAGHVLALLDLLVAVDAARG